METGKRENRINLWLMAVVCVLLFSCRAVPARAEGTTHSGFTAGDGNGYTAADESYDKLVDGNLDTKWYSDIPSTPPGESESCLRADFHADAPFWADEYSLTTGNDTAGYPGRNPATWILKAKNKESDPWTTIASVTIQYTQDGYTRTATQPITVTAPPLSIPTRVTMRSDGFVFAGGKYYLTSPSLQFTWDTDSPPDTGSIGCGAGVVCIDADFLAALGEEPKAGTDYYGNTAQKRRHKSQIHGKIKI